MPNENNHPPFARQHKFKLKWPTTTTVTNDAELVFTNANRPDASTFPVGTRIYNLDDKTPNWSDGEYWRDEDGHIT